MRTTLSLAIASLAAALLAGCAALSLSPSPEGATPQAREAKGQSLLYAIVGTGAVNIVTYRDGEKAGSIEYGPYSYLTGECSDRSGNVWIADYATLAEYAHGGTKTIARKSFRWYVGGCSVDPASNDLAAVGQEGRAYVFRDERGKAHVYHTNPSYQLRYCGYDAHGNLFVDGVSNYGRTPCTSNCPATAASS